MMDDALVLWVSSLIELSRVRWLAGAGDSWRPGTRLRLLFAGYNGSRNTGSDVRVEEMLRQVRAVLGGENVELTVMTQDFQRTHGYFGDARQVRLPDIFPPFLYREVPRHHGVLACEGSMFKSKFANALTAMMVGSLGIAAAQNKISVGYGAEAGAMDPSVRRMTRNYCRQALVITRNEASAHRLRELGVPTEVGTDTAWTFEPKPVEVGRALLRQAGWDGTTPVLAVCPINPFWWPVKPSLAKAIGRRAAGMYRSSHYRSIYFHNAGPEVDRAYERYLQAFAGAIETWRRERAVFPVMVAMERLDADACRRIGDRVGGLPILTSDDHDMYELVSVLRACDSMIASRYHGIVTSMPGLVPAIGVTMDERIENLLRDCGHERLCFTVDDPDLEEKLVTALRELVRDREPMKERIGRTVVQQLQLMARMGVYLEDHVRRHLPEFPVSTGRRSWESYLPPMSSKLLNLVEAHGG
jgi:polysaccharide pyruvyl transferase WcaK-like protein